MNAVVEFVSHLRQRGVRLSIEGEQLRYRAPAGLVTQADLASLKQMKAEIIALLGEATVKKPELKPVRRTGAHRPSREQLGWWDSIRRGLIAGPDWLHIAAALRLRGTLDISLLEQAATALIARHDIMRARFVEIDGQPSMLIDDPEPIHLEFQDLSDVPVAEREMRAKELATAFKQRPFESLAERLFRFALLRLSPTDHVFVLVVHHILSDAQSVATLQSELQELYRAYAAGQPAKAPGSFQYPDYAAWQHSWMSDERQTAYLLRLRNRVSGPLKFPADTTAASADPPTKLTCRFTIPADVMSSIQTLARKEGTTKYLVILAALKIALAEWTRQSNVTVASVGNLRIHEALMGMLGPFSALDLMSTDLYGTPTFSEVLARLMKAHADAQDFRPYAPSTEYRSLVNVFVDYIRDFGADMPQATAKDRGNLGDSLWVEELPLIPVADKPLPQWALIFIVREVEGGVDAMLRFSSARFSMATVQRAVDRFQAILREVQQSDFRVRSIETDSHETV